MLNAQCRYKYGGTQPCWILVSWIFWFVCLFLGGIAVCFFLVLQICVDDVANDCLLPKMHRKSSWNCSSLSYRNMDLVHKTLQLPCGFLPFVSAWTSAHETWLFLCVMFSKCVFLSNNLTFCDLLHVTLSLWRVLPTHHFDIIRVTTNGTIASFSSQFYSLNFVNVLQVHTQKDNKTLFQKNVI